MEKGAIKEAFEYYKKNGVTIEDVANEFRVCSRTIWRLFSKTYRKKYRKISKVKSYEHTIKVTEKQIKNAFKEFKKGKEIKPLAESLGIKEETLKIRFLDEFKDEYTSIKRTKGKKVQYNEIKEAFKGYKKNKISIEKIAEELGLTESSLISRFKTYFNTEYKIIAKSRRDERKVTKEEYIEAFNIYKNTPISLTELANSLDITVSSLRSRFIRLFDKEYKDVANQKMNYNFLNERGKIAEELAWEYFKIIGIEVDDIRKKLLIKNSLKRPDFIIGENFVEVKSYFIKYSNKKLKGYKEIIDSYLNKECVDGGVLKFGIIVSLTGFSEVVWKRALRDGITLIDHNDLKRRFDEANRQDLINLIEHYFLPLNCIVS